MILGSVFFKHGRSFFFQYCTFCRLALADSPQKWLQAIWCYILKLANHLSKAFNESVFQWSAISSTSFWFEGQLSGKVLALKQIASKFNHLFIFGFFEISFLIQGFQIDNQSLSCFVSQNKINLCISTFVFHRRIIVTYFFFI